MTKSRAEETIDRASMAAGNVEEVRALVRAWDQEVGGPPSDIRIGMVALVIDVADPVGAEVHRRVAALRSRPMPDGQPWHSLCYRQAMTPMATIFWIITEAARVGLAGLALAAERAIREDAPPGMIFAVIVASGGALLTTIAIDGGAVDLLRPAAALN